MAMVHCLEELSGSRLVTSSTVDRQTYFPSHGHYLLICNSDIHVHVSEDLIHRYKRVIIKQFKL